MKVISLFNHKGGVSKTTTAFNLGWMLAEHGHKPLIVDTDPQCNLTALVLDYNSVEDIEEFYANNQGCGYCDRPKTCYVGESIRLKTRSSPFAQKTRIYFCIVETWFSEFETQISVALTTSQAIPAIRNILGSVNELLRKKNWGRAWV